MRTRITVTLDSDLLEEIDERRGLIPRSRFVEQLLLGVWQEEKEEVVRGYG